MEVLFSFLNTLSLMCPPGWLWGPSVPCGGAVGGSWLEADVPGIGQPLPLLAEADLQPPPLASGQGWPKQREIQGQLPDFISSCKVVLASVPSCLRVSLRRAGASPSPSQPFVPLPLGAWE